jgi:hypothetical protein
MQDNCAGKLDPTACQTNCVTDAPWRRNCRLSHCELALNSADEHCLHATDELKACEATAPMPDPNCEKKQIGYGCKSPDDCCSGFCPDGFCRLM